MATLMESTGRRTLKDLDHIGGLSIQWWARSQSVSSDYRITSGKVPSFIVRRRNRSGFIT